jgi:raffinose/stachyose/melibiose transport system substrate-binding protein
MLNDFLRRMTPLTRSTAGAALALAIGAAASGSAHAQALVTWDDYTFAAQSAVIEQLNKNFEAAHPGVTVQRTARTFDDLSMTLKLAVSAGNGPVVTKVNQGAGDMGAMVKENLLVPLDPYIAKFGWDKRQSDSVLARDRWSDKGEFGVGKTYGISGLGEMVGLYYNLKVLTDAGLKAPTSFEDFLSELDALKAKGIAPIMLGTAKGHLALHMITGIAQAHIDAANRKPLDDLIYGHGGTFKTKDNLDAAALVQHWAKDGYLYAGFQGISGDDSVQLFVAGQGAFLLDGTWYFGDMQVNPDIHFMPVPAPAGVKAPLSVGGIDLAWAISTVAKDQASKDAAGQYIDYMVSDEAAKAWATAGYLPAVALADASGIKMTSLLTEGIAMWNKLNANNALGHYDDWASPTLLKTFDENTPLLLANSETPEAFVDALDKDYKAYMATMK